MEYPIVKETFANKDIPVHVQDTMGTNAIRTGPNQYEAGVKGIYLPEKFGPRERIYLAEGPTAGEFGTEYAKDTNHPYIKHFDVTRSVEDVLRHEVAHPISDRFYREWIRDMDNTKANQVFDKIEELRKEWQPSTYAKESNHEWISETFAKYTHPEFAKHLDMPPKVQEFMKRMVNAAKMSDIDVTGLSVLLKVGGAAIAYEVLFGDKDTKERLAGLASMVAFHGTPEHNVRKIEKTGHLKPWGVEGIEKISGGNMTEKGLVWVTPDELIASQYAKAMEANMAKGKEYKPGAIFKADIPDNLKLIDRSQRLTKEQVDILNPHLPDYKPLHEGDSFYSWEYRSNGKPLAEAIKLLGYDGMTYGDKQIALLADKVPVKMHKDLRGTEPVTREKRAPVEERKPTPTVDEVLKMIEDYNQEIKI